MGVKAMPREDLLAEKTYMFFSHVVKAQPDNMTMLDAILEKVRSGSSRFYGWDPDLRVRLGD